MFCLGTSVCDRFDDEFCQSEEYESSCVSDEDSYSYSPQRIIEYVMKCVYSFLSPFSHILVLLYAETLYFLTILLCAFFLLFFHFSSLLPLLHYSRREVAMPALSQMDRSERTACI